MIWFFLKKTAQDVSPLELMQNAAACDYLRQFDKGKKLHHFSIDSKKGAAICISFSTRCDGAQIFSMIIKKS